MHHLQKCNVYKRLVNIFLPWINTIANLGLSSPSPHSHFLFLPPIFHSQLFTWCIYRKCISQLTESSQISKIYCYRIRRQTYYYSSLQDF